MYDKLSDHFSEEIKETVTNKMNNDVTVPNVDAETVKQGTTSIFESLKDQLMDGNMDEIMGMFKSRAMNMFDNPMIKSLVSSAAGKLSAAKGIDAETSEAIVKNTLPEVMNKIEEKDADDSPFSIDSMLKVLKGDGNAEGLLSGLTSSITRGLGGLFK